MATSSSPRLGSDSRLSFQESMELTELPSPGASGTRRFMSRRPAWLPGGDIYDITSFVGKDKPLGIIPVASFGGNVYSQAALAACRVVDSEERENGREAGQARLGLHTVHGIFCSMGVTDRPFIYDVTPISTQWSFVSRLVVARQPRGCSASTDPFPQADGSSELGPVCFSALVSLRLPEPHSAGVSLQEPSAQVRFADVLAQRPNPEDWPPAPPIDLDSILSATGRDIVGDFPIVHMRKVDMRSYNASRPLHEQRELVLYRILKPLPVSSAEDANAHALVHAFEADRNGLLMLANLLGFDHALKKVASLSYSFVVHTNVDELRMRHESETTDGKSEWWIQEVTYPRVAAGRGVLECKIWSPNGTHVATEYQDGMCAVREGVSKTGVRQEKGKL